MEGSGGKAAGAGAADGGDGTGIIAKWLRKHGVIYDQATRHPFVLSIRAGSVDISSFKRWLMQDYLFVREFVPFTASVLVKAWKNSDNGEDVEVTLSGMASLHDEISWFKKEASKWGVSLTNVYPQRANQDYCRFLQDLMVPEVDYTIVIVAFWIIESVYQKSFSLCLEEGSRTPLELLETCQRWGNDSFGEYCHTIQEIADRCLEKASEDTVRMAEEAFVKVLEHEIKFWNMSDGES